ncbi:acyl-CoA dehydrogenase family protein [Saccharopolyspora sp. TS4A08]|uniref:Acyl-CoA dehydrogenase family protein n=1 Tax=Saccharopolyspora ipomoeae TaxID=3042027 RepID=A0ABT6PP47_9PSEU|nr:acyl-CoA dehydrogenase family protein [Saccharopolyspora sp. TS4A08]MDI2029789.1 acyl-CoA dehydrogenase family protein [Saccharopolyspora sp. TS4A08]
MTDLLYTEVEEDLRSGVRRVLRDRCDWTAVLARVETDEPYDLDLWRSLAGEMGLAGLLVPEELGGAGATARELSVVAEEIGRAVAPVPFLSTVLATAALVGCRERTVLPQLVDGSQVGTLAVGLTTAPHAPFPQAVKAESSALTGRVSAVVDLEVADHVVVPAVDADGSALYLVEAAAATRTPTTPLDLTRRFGTLELDGTPGQRIASGAEAEAAVRRALVTAAGTLAAEQVGLAQHCLDTTVEYGKTRYQFGRQIGSFQAIKHRLADLWTKISMARAVSRNASDALASGSEEELAVALAQAYVSDLVVRAAEEHLQLHGGIGMTWEHPAHLYLGRAKSSQLTFGIAEVHRARIAELVDLPGGSA